MSFWDEIKKAGDKAEDLYGTTTKILAGDVDFAPVGDSVSTPDYIAPAPAPKESTLGMAGAWWSELPQPVKLGAYGLGAVGILGLAWKIFK